MVLVCTGRRTKALEGRACSGALVVLGESTLVWRPSSESLCHTSLGTTVHIGNKWMVISAAVR